MLHLFMGMYHGEKAKIVAAGAPAASLLRAICQMRQACGGCQLGSSAGAHVVEAGLVLSVTILDQQPPAPRDGVSGHALLAAAEDLKARANALLNAGFTAGAMRKCVRAAAARLAVGLVPHRHARSRAHLPRPARAEQVRARHLADAGWR